MDIKSQRHKVSGMVANLDREGEKTIHRLHERCGGSEEVHAVMKDDLAGGKLPSDDFGENAAWWWIMILAHNLNAMMKRFSMEESRLPERMKAIRFSFINLRTCSQTFQQSDSPVNQKQSGHGAFDKSSQENCNASADSLWIG